ncbi:Protein YIPF7 [Linum perenne]
MAREFSIPPIVFPSGTNPSIIDGANMQQHRVPTAPFQPPRTANTRLPFMSFDMASAPAASYGGGPIGRGPAPSDANFDDEEPLVDELGIHPDQIWRKTKSILNPFRVNSDVHKDSDLSGPIFLYLSLCLFQLLVGKI